MSLVLLWVGCATSSRTECRGDPDDMPIVAAASAGDYSAGSLMAVSRDEVCDVASLHGDAVVSVVDEVVYAIGRLGSDTVRRYDTLTAEPTWEIGTGRASNPQAVAGSDGRLVVTRLADASLLVVDARDGSELARVDLAEWDDGDGAPEAQWAVFDEGIALVALQRLDTGSGFAADPVAYVLGVDLAAAEVRFAVQVGPNPWMSRHPGGGAVVVTEDGAWWRVHADGRVEGPVDGGIEGVVAALDVAEDGRVVAVKRVCTDCAEHAVVCRSAWDGVVTGETELVSAYLSDVVVDDGAIWVAARRGWTDPEGSPGGVVVMPLDGCGPVPAPETWLRGTFPPFALAVRRSARR